MYRGYCSWSPLSAVFCIQVWRLGTCVWWCRAFPHLRVLICDLCARLSSLTWWCKLPLSQGGSWCHLCGWAWLETFEWRVMVMGEQWFELIQRSELRVGTHYWAWVLIDALVQIIAYFLQEIWDVVCCIDAVFERLVSWWGLVPLTLPLSQLGWRMIPTSCDDIGGL